MDAVAAAASLYIPSAAAIIRPVLETLTWNKPSKTSTDRGPLAAGRVGPAPAHRGPFAAGHVANRSLPPDQLPDLRFRAAHVPVDDSTVRLIVFADAHALGPLQCDTGGLRVLVGELRFLFEFGDRGTQVANLCLE